MAFLDGTLKTVKVDISNRYVDEELAGILSRFFARTGATAKARAQQILSEEVTDRTGELKARTNFIVHAAEDAVYLEFYNDAGAHALYQHEGTGIYGPKGRPIRPVRARMLTWIDPDTGRRVWAKEVRGTPATKFLEKAIDFALEQEIRRINS